MNDVTYCGWKNWETWIACIWLENEREVMEWVRSETKIARNRKYLANELLKYAQKNYPKDFSDERVELNIIDWKDLSEHYFNMYDRENDPDLDDLPPLLNSISRMIVNGNRLELPQHIKFENYAEVRNAMLKADGKYKKNGFAFKEPAQTIYDRFLAGEKMNKKQEYQFFETPNNLVEKITLMADIPTGCDLLEPSAGRASMLKHVPICNVDCVELDPHNIEHLEEHGYNIVGGDFMEFDPVKKYDRIIANPPFSKGQDMAHVTKMIDLCKQGGKVVSVMSTGWQGKTDKKSVAFQKLMRDYEAEITQIEAGTFKSSGTMIATCIVEINIPVNAFSQTG